VLVRYPRREMAEALRSLSHSLDETGEVVDPEGVASGSSWKV